jgi:hypothetical protein
LFQPLIDLVPAEGRITYEAWRNAVMTGGLYNLLQQGFNQLRKTDIQLVNETDPETGALVTYVQRRSAEGQG